MSDQRKAQCKKTFDKFDKSGDGFLTIQEVAQVLRSCGSNLSDAEIAEIFAQEDKDSDSKVSFDEFWASQCKRDPNTVKEEELRTVFKDMDVDGSGFITASDLKVVLKNANLSEEDFESIVDEVDKNNDDKVNFEEFLVMWKSKLC